MRTNARQAWQMFLTRSRGPRSQKTAMTLLEVLIVLVFLSFLSITTFQSLRGIMGAKQAVDQKSELMQELRAVSGIMERDIRAAFFFKVEDFVWEPVTKNPNDATAPPVPPPPRPLSPSIFQGTNNYIFFSSRSHQRLSGDSPENEMHFVTYQLYQSDLIRAESPRAVTLRDREDPKGFRQFVLLNNVKSVEFKFWDSKKEGWVDSWDTDKADYSERLPSAVKITIEYQPETPPNARIKVELSKFETAVRISEEAFKSDTHAKAPTTPGPTPNPSPSPGGGVQ